MPTPQVVETHRVSGTTATQTAVQIAEQTGWTGQAILASSTSYGMVDALTAGPLAFYLKAPILLTEAGNTLNPDTKAELIKLKVRTVYVTSGTGVISQAILNELKGMGISVESLGGVDRFATSANIAQKMVDLGAQVDKVAIAYGWKNQDALSIASIASAQTQPILLTEKEIIPNSVKTFLITNNIKATDVIGGTGVISNGLITQLPSATRHAGNTAYDTNTQVLKDFDASIRYDHVYLANGETGIDALAGAPLAAQSKAAIILTNQVVPEAATFVKSKLTSTSVVTALGGKAAVPETVLTRVSSK
ncbi:MAG: cell wall-binding repeat-containing protein [Desulfosporosinus sp.]|nr:cell wall-binding repeat-containing protein [Desulfosporosinus sp.]MBC2726044.1 cell wall-binding repeat-containing protein [Desulfosporosinus sp.]